MNTHGGLFNEENRNLYYVLFVSALVTPDNGWGEHSSKVSRRTGS